MLYNNCTSSGINHDSTCLHKRLHTHAAIGLMCAFDVRVIMCAWSTMHACTSARALPRSQHFFGSWTISTCTQFVTIMHKSRFKCVCVIWVGGREMVIHWKVRQVTHTHGNPRWGEFEIYRHRVQQQWHLHRISINMRELRQQILVQLNYCNSI